MRGGDISVTEDVQYGYSLEKYNLCFHIQLVILGQILFEYLWSILSDYTDFV